MSSTVPSPHPTDGEPMEPTSPELDAIADVLRRWQRVDGPLDRVRVVTDATDALRNLSRMDAQVLAQGLWEHGAAPAAQQVAQRTGASEAPEELAEVAQAVLALDRDEVERFADELRDPEQRRRLLAGSRIEPDEPGRHPPQRPPAGDSRIDVPPPPGTEQPEEQSTPPPERSPDPPLHAADPAEPDERHPEVVAGHPPGEDHASESSTGRDAGPTALPETTHHGAPAEAGHTRTQSLDPAGGLSEALRDARNGRERLRRLDEHQVVVHGAELLDVLHAVPDGWQRRTVLRKLLAAGQVSDVPDARSIVTSFGRNGDRFAVAALLARTRTAAPDAVLPALTERDAARLRRRVHT